MDPFDDALGRLDARRRDAAAQEAAKAAAATNVPEPDPRARDLLHRFVRRMPPGSEKDLVRCWREVVEETHYPPSGLFGRRQKRSVPLLKTFLRTEAVARGWALPGFGRAIPTDFDRDADEQVHAHFTVAVTTDAQLLLAARCQFTSMTQSRDLSPTFHSREVIVVDGELDRHPERHPKVQDRYLNELGPIRGDTFEGALTRRFPIDPPMRDTGESRLIDSRFMIYERIKEIEPGWNHYEAVLKKLTEAMALEIRAAEGTDS